MIGHLHSTRQTECKQHLLNYRPWGSYEIHAIDGRFPAKRIIVNPDTELSLQTHHHRAEH